MKLAEILTELSTAVYKRVADEALKRVIPAITGSDGKESSVKRGVKHATAAQRAKKKLETV